MSAAFLALQYSSLIKTSNPTYAAQLFNYAQFQACAPLACLFSVADEMCILQIDQSLVCITERSPPRATNELQVTKKWQWQRRVERMDVFNLLVFTN